MIFRNILKFICPRLSRHGRGLCCFSRRTSLVEDFPRKTVTWRSHRSGLLLLNSALSTT